MTRDELLAKLRELKPWLEAQGIVNVRLFGSYARDEAGPDSDVDLLVEVTRPLPGSWGRPDVEAGLSEKLGLDVQVVTEQALTNPYIRYTAERDALVV
ncbi:MAG: nucleotidyltransferase domain-containing protein [Brevundimonas sp.]|uniref:nucleotidyltransferase family protein n=1 Tax=Brevundimonas sp. TaxID=1871086 RepID=UPI0017CD115A|nr:nucleotidyltransferase domain-containing protein [Brevundimonas sp.]MBA4804264.1 nucleotidyltransferase domain-containing protein [Brevundimonas sp.]